MTNSSLVVVLTSYDGKDPFLISTISSLFTQGYNPIILDGLSRDFVRSTAYVLKYALLKFPPDSIFIVLNHLTSSTVVARYDNRTIIVPNNGLVTMVSEHLDSLSVFDKSLPTLLNSKPLYDILQASQEGHVIEAFLPEPVIDNELGQIIATIIHIDSYGNVVTNVNNLENIQIFSTLASKEINFVKRNVILYSFEFAHVYPTYPFDVPPGKEVVFRDEMGYLSCGIINGNLAGILNLNEYVHIKIRLKQEQSKQVAPFLSIPEKQK